MGCSVLALHSAGHRPLRLLWGRRCCCLHGDHKGCCWFPSELGVGLGCRFTNCSLLGKPKASTLECLTVQGMWWRWINPAQCFREVLKGKFWGTMPETGCTHLRKALLMSRITFFSTYKMFVSAKHDEDRHQPSLRTAGNSRRYRRKCYASI